ncbi:MAG: YicC family protein [Ferruginibacter sp.]|nr:YicC family protein [Cytophagales bacterium]
MIKSMTGFGTATVENAGFSVTVEVKSLNAKVLDASFRLPRNLSDKEIELRNLLTQSLERGKVNLSVDVQRTGEVKPRVSVNRALVSAYYRDLVATAAELGTSPNDCFRLALQMPEAYSFESNGEEARQAAAEEWEHTRTATEGALRECNHFREQEGNALEIKFYEYADRIQTLLGRVADRDPHRIAAVRERLRKHVADLVTEEQFDRNRFEQELIYYIEKYDISEEKVRLITHLDYFREILRAPDANGKKLNFIAQEIGREINTIGSKANDAEIQRCVIEMKEELEKIKEQSLNIL